MTTLLPFVPFVNLVALIGGYIYGMAVLKLALKAFADDLKEIKEITKSLEHRVTIVETKCDSICKVNH